MANDPNKQQVKTSPCAPLATVHAANAWNITASQTVAGHTTFCQPVWTGWPFPFPIALTPRTNMRNGRCWYQVFVNSFPQQYQVDLTWELSSWRLRFGLFDGTFGISDDTDWFGPATLSPAGIYAGQAPCVDPFNVTITLP